MASNFAKLPKLLSRANAHRLCEAYEIVAGSGLGATVFEVLFG